MDRQHAAVDRRSDGPQGPRRRRHRNGGAAAILTTARKRELNKEGSSDGGGCWTAMERAEVMDGVSVTLGCACRAPGRQLRAAPEQHDAVDWTTTGKVGRLTLGLADAGD
jgi:hypothetical protein